VSGPRTSVRKMRDAFLEAADSAIALLSRPEVSDQWDSPSALAEWSVGGLAGHLASEVPIVLQVLAAPVGDERPIPLAEHYARAAWVTSAVDDDVNIAIRRSTDDAAAAGPAELVEGTTAARDAVATALVDQPADRVVVIPWQGWALTLGDFLVTRMMEIAVHSDDLAASVGVEAPGLSAAVLDPVLTLLTGLAVRRHGQAAVLRALTRRERAGASIAAF
jgi:Mycothiol maleylpyruvate isomerase N-terminal domain